MAIFSDTTGLNQINYENRGFLYYYVRIAYRKGSA